MVLGTNRIIWRGANIYKEYITDPSSYESEINFAWEDITLQRLNDTGLKLLSDVTDIIVIGYSFPYFNREIDDLIFSYFNFRILRRIYLQYPEGVHSSIKERIKNMLPPDVEVIPRTDTDLFFIPDDF